MDPLTVLTTFVAIFPAELPDKTMVASMVLATRYNHPRAVWAGATAAFAVHMAIAVLAGSLLALLPTRPVQLVVAGLFAVGAFLLWRDDDASAPDQVDVERPAATALQAAAGSFVVIFLAEWGDLTQLATASLSASTGQPLAVFVGALAALSAVAALAVLAGRTVMRVVPVRLVRRIAAVIFAVLALVTLVEAIRG